MEKDKTIIRLIERLKLTFNFSTIQIVDYWEADLCAIGLKKKRKLVYISTYNYTEQKTISYDFDFEIVSDKSEQEKPNVVKTGRNVTEPELINQISQFFNFSNDKES